MSKSKGNFRQVSRVETIKLEKRTNYDHDQFYDLKARVVNGDYFEIEAGGSQSLNIKTSMTAGCLDALIEDLILLRAGGIKEE